MPFVRSPNEREKEQPQSLASTAYSQPHTTKPRSSSSSREATTKKHYAPAVFGTSTGCTHRTQCMRPLYAANFGQQILFVATALAVRTHTRAFRCAHQAARLVNHKISKARRRKENNSPRAAFAKKRRPAHTHKPHVRCNFCAKARAGFASVCTVLEFVLSSLAN